jgi:ribose 5-phosphate isomerase A
MNPKQLAGEKAVEFIKEGMKVGLGTGSTVYFTVLKLSEKVRKGFQIKAVCTSVATHKLAVSLNIPILSMEEVDQLDLTIDGADEIDPNGHGIKGRWGALLFEKIVAANSRQNIWVVDNSKIVDHLGKFPLPVEVIPFGYKQVVKKFVESGYNPEIKMEGKETFKTDSGNFIIQLNLGKIDDPVELDRSLKHIPGVVEHGLFTGIVNKAVVADKSHIRIINYR